MSRPCIRCEAQVIVTMNLKDFPNEILQKYEIEAQHQTNSFSTSLTSPPTQSWMPPKRTAKVSRTRRSPLKNFSPRSKRKAYHNPRLLCRCCISEQLRSSARMLASDGCVFWRCGGWLGEVGTLRLDQIRRLSRNLIDHFFDQCFQISSFCIKLIG